MARISRFKLRNSDRSGFKFFEIELVKDGPWKVAGDERDTPPPSRFPLGGEGDVSTGDQLANSNFSLGVSATSASDYLQNPTVFVTAAAGVTPSFSHPWMRVTGSNDAITISATPNIARGQQGQVLTLQCIDSAITLTQSSANAIAFLDSRANLQLTSGMVITFIYNSANQCWNECSHFRP